MAKSNTRNVEMGTARPLLRVLSPQSLFFDLFCETGAQLGPVSTSLAGSRELLEGELATLSQGVFPPCISSMWPLGAFGTTPWLTSSRRTGTSSGIYPPVMFPSTPCGFPDVSPTPQRGNFLGSFRGTWGGSFSMFLTQTPPEGGFLSVSPSIPHLSKLLCHPQPHYR